MMIVLKLLSLSLIGFLCAPELKLSGIPRDCLERILSFRVDGPRGHFAKICAASCSPINQVIAKGISESNMISNIDKAIKMCDTTNEKNYLQCIFSPEDREWLRQTLEEGKEVVRQNSSVFYELKGSELPHEGYISEKYQKIAKYERMLKSIFQRNRAFIREINSLMSFIIDIKEDLVTCIKTATAAGVFLDLQGDSPTAPGIFLSSLQPCSSATYGMSTTSSQTDSPTTAGASSAQTDSSDTDALNSH